MDRSRMKIRSEAAAPITKLIMKRIEKVDNITFFGFFFTCKCDHGLDSICK